MVCESIPVVSWFLPFWVIVAGAPIDELAKVSEGAPSFFPHPSGPFQIIFPSFFLSALTGWFGRHRSGYPVPAERYGDRAGRGSEIFEWNHLQRQALFEGHRCRRCPGPLCRRALDFGGGWSLFFVRCNPIPPSSPIDRARVSGSPGVERVCSGLGLSGKFPRQQSVWGHHG